MKGELLTMIMMPFNKAFTYSTRLKGADDCEHNYLELGFDLHDHST